MLSSFDLSGVKPWNIELAGEFLDFFAESLDLVRFAKSIGKVLELLGTS